MHKQMAAKKEYLLGSGKAPIKYQYIGSRKMHNGPEFTDHEEIVTINSMLLGR